MIKQFLLVASFLFFVGCGSPVFAAATYYVQPKGGTPTECSGLSAKDYVPIVSDLTRDCALAHPNWVLAPQGNNPSLLKGGDTLIIDGSNKAQYMIGFGSPNTADTGACSTNWTWDCYLRAVPSGPDAAHPTRILGKGWDSDCSAPPQLWGTERVGQVLNLSGSSNVQVQCLEITDHSECLQNGPDAATKCNRDTYPHGPWANVGLIASDSSNVLLKNVNIHGLTSGVHAGRLTNWVIDTTKIIGNSMVGWDGDIGAGQSSNSGTIHFVHTEIKFSGCGEKLNGVPYNCYSQDQGGYGDGLGTQGTGGNWVFDDCDVSNNVSDGIDLLYHDNTGKVVITNSRTENNAGNQIKVSTNTEIANTVVTGKCDWFDQNPQYLWNKNGFNNCRAAGNAVVFAFYPGMTATINGGQVSGDGDTVLLSTGQSCTGNEFISMNNVTAIPSPLQYNGGGDATVLYYASGTDGNGSGKCGAIKLVQGTAPVVVPPVIVTPPPVTGPVFVPSTPTCVSNGLCNAPLAACEQVTSGVDNCGKLCTKTGVACATINSATVSITCNGKTYSLTK